jgi:hypothetical protein
MIPQVLVAEKTVAQLRTQVVRLLPQAGKLPYGRLGGQFFLMRLIAGLFASLPLIARQAICHATCGHLLSD